MAHKISSDAEFAEMIAKDQLVICTLSSFFTLIAEHPGFILKAVVEFCVVSCGHCKAIAPYVDTLAEENPGISVSKVDIEELHVSSSLSSFLLLSSSFHFYCSDYFFFLIFFQSLTTAQGVTMTPTFQFFKKGEKVHEIKGSDRNALLATVLQYK